MLREESTENSVTLRARTCVRVSHSLRALVLRLHSFDDCACFAVGRCCMCRFLLLFKIFVFLNYKSQRNFFFSSLALAPGFHFMHSSLFHFHPCLFHEHTHFSFCHEPIDFFRVTYSNLLPSDSGWLYPGGSGFISSHYRNS